MAVVDLIYFPISVPDNWPANLTWKETLLSLSRVNWIPFNYGPLFLYPTSAFQALKDIFANILLTVPFGFGICFLLPLRKKQIIWTAVGVGLALDGLQLLMKLTLGSFIHSVDITDVLTNTLGVFIGAGLYRAAERILERIKKDFSGRFNFGKLR
jgi:glycopeptide antibiotics resistance protein